MGTPRVAAALTQAGARVEYLVNHFPRGTPDDVWLPPVGRFGWIVLSRDKDIRYRQNEIEAVTTAGVRMFVLVGKNMTGLVMGAAFARALPAMRRLVQERTGAFIAHVRRDGRVTVMTSDRQHGTLSAPSAPPGASPGRTRR